MMVSLFSIFDPVIYFFSPWLVFFFFFLLLTAFFPLLGSFTYYVGLLMGLMLSEFFSVLKLNLKRGVLFFIVVMFFYIFVMNFVALFPSVFAVTGQMVFSLFFSLSFWLFLMSFLIVLNLRNFLIHLVPVGTPFALMFFMVLVELISNMIRPLTLSVRLVANMVAGHLLMILLGNFIMSLSFLLGSFTFFLGFILAIMELAVSFIQAYVFMILFSLYMEEIH